MARPDTATVSPAPRSRSIAVVHLNMAARGPPSRPASGRRAPRMGARRPGARSAALLDRAIARQHRLVRQVVEGDLEPLGLELLEGPVRLLLPQERVQVIDQALVALLDRPR